MASFWHLPGSLFLTPSPRPGGALGSGLSSADRSEKDAPGEPHMNTITIKDGMTIYFKDWGPKHAKPIMFHHGWPLSSDDWDAQMLYFLQKGYRVVAHDRRGHGRSSQVSE